MGEHLNEVSDVQMIYKEDGKDTWKPVASVDEVTISYQEPDISTLNAGSALKEMANRCIRVWEGNYTFHTCHVPFEKKYMLFKTCFNNWRKMHGLPMVSKVHLREEYKCRRKR